ncbi:MAG: hydantoinase B/oxoprolinase family protein [Dehalococcoidia bacterium]
MPVDPVSLEVFRNLFASVAEEMGVALGRTAFSPNIKERKDYSCALFDPQGNMVAQAAHIPVHLGSMPASVQAAIAHFTFATGDIVILNDPYMGGTHLNDVTLVAPVFVGETLVGFVGNRGHHADIGGMTPGSLPLSTDLYQEGFIFPPLKLAKGGVLNEEVITLFCRNSRTPEERKGDLAAQVAACRTGERRLQDLVHRYGWETVREHMSALLDYAERLTRAAIRSMPKGSYSFRDYMDDDGLTNEPVPIQVTVRILEDSIEFDWTGTSPQRLGCTNTPLAVAVSAVLYVMRCILGEQVPANQGILRAVRIIAPEGTLVNPHPPAAVAGGNVETSQRLVDVLLGALAQALPHLIPAASQGTMNNVLVGGHDPIRNKTFAYYETIAGGMGASPTKDGLSAVHTHMTNTMNTPVEALEMVYPLRVRRYTIRRGSGGQGKYRGGDGIIRDLEFLAPATVTVLSERRRSRPWGLQGGEPGQPGENILLKGGIEEVRLPPKVTLRVDTGDLVSIRTPGGGGWGKADTPPTDQRGER